MQKTTDLSLDDLPSYSESTSYGSSTSLSKNLALVRTARIHSLLETHITPHLHATTLAGLSSSTLILIPSNVSSLQPKPTNGNEDLLRQQASFPGETIVGFPNVENLTLIRLQGQENSFEFWRQTAVMIELDRILHAQVKRERGLDLFDAPLVDTPRKSKGWLRKRTPSGQEKNEVIRGSKSGEVITEVRLEDVSLRTENAMGLYETKAGKAVVVKVVIGEC